LTIIAEVNPAAASMATGFFVRTGSRDESGNLAGVSHFLEHMVFKGTDRRSPADVNREFDEIGALYNAMTGEEFTVYFGATLPEFSTRLMDILCDIIRPSLRQEDFDVEKGVILQEIAMYQDRPKYRVLEKLMTKHFANHPLGNSVLGTNESITALSRDEMLEYFNRRYSPGNMVLVGVGNIDFEAIIDKTAEMCSAWKPYEAVRKLDRPTGTRGREIIFDKKVSREHIGIMANAPSAQDQSRYAAYLAATIVGDTTGSRLFYALIEPAIADEAVTAYEPFDNAGVFFTLVAAAPDKAAKAIEITQQQFHQLQDEGPTEAELLAAKNKIASSATIKCELPMGRLTAVGFDWLHRKEYIPLADQIEKIFAVTRDEVVQTIHKYDLASTTVLALGPLESI